MNDRSFVSGTGCGITAVLLIGATRSASVPSPPETIGLLNVVLHRFDMVPGRRAAFRAGIGLLRRRRQEAVATPCRGTYPEATFTARDEPQRLYWPTVRGAGGNAAGSATFDLEIRHMRFRSRPAAAIASCAVWALLITAIYVTSYHPPVGMSSMACFEGSTCPLPSA